MCVVGLYCSGWAASGPVGVIASTQGSSFACSATLLKDLSQTSPLQVKAGSAAVLSLLKERGQWAVKIGQR